MIGVAIKTCLLTDMIEPVEDVELQSVRVYSNTVSPKLNRPVAKNNAQSTYVGAVSK